MPQKSVQKKRRKRKGIAGFFAALGCLSAGEFEEDEKEKGSGNNVMTQRPGAATTQSEKEPAAAAGPSTLATEPAPNVSAEQGAGTAGTIGMTPTPETILVDGDASQDRGAAEADGTEPGAVIVAPVEPVTLPEEEVSAPFEKRDSEIAGI